mmetsp:Transcript_41654/g.77634  ORF Transcript_41654/g.77634 Transcript_41654/m.77634 type:complete len:197 (-) Transcript_41654:117-707(-)
MPESSGSNREYYNYAPEYGWRQNPLFMGNVDLEDKHGIAAAPVEMRTYPITQRMTAKELYMKPTIIEGSLVYEVIKLQQELKFHFYYTGVDPQKGDGQEPAFWVCAVIYMEKYLPAITAGLKKIGVDIDDIEPSPLTEDIEEFVSTVIVRSPGTWVTACDPWMKVLSDGDTGLESGSVYRHNEEIIKSKKFDFAKD